MIRSFSCYLILLWLLDLSNLYHHLSKSIILPISPTMTSTLIGRQCHQSSYVERICHICLLVVLKVTLRNQYLWFSLLNFHFFLFRVLLCLRSHRWLCLLLFFHLGFRMVVCYTQIRCSMGKTTSLHTLSIQFQTLMIIVFYNKLKSIKT